MSLFLTILLGLPALAGLVLALLLLAEILAAAGSSARAKTAWPAPGPYAVVVPAHNEEAVIGATLGSLLPALREGDRLLVIADNCTDRTAALAREAGAEVVERFDDTLRGKGYALQHALDLLKASPPTSVIFVDADCIAEPGTFDALAGAAEATGRPVQALNIMEGGGDSPRARVSRFAWLLINKLRMRGLHRLSGHCRLLGTGMAMPWALVKDLDMASGEIVEDISLALDLSQAGHAPIFVEDGTVRSSFPESPAAATTQRARWEIGSLRLGRKKALPLLLKSLMRGRIGPAILALDILIPPLVLFAGLLLGLVAITLPAAFLGAPWPLLIALGALFAYGLAVLLAWWAEGRAVLPLSMAGGLLAFAAAKTGIYGGEGRRSAAKWTRTDRH